MKAFLFTALSLVLLAGCTHTPPLAEAGNRCEIKRYILEQPLPDEPDLDSILQGRTGDMLLLSGGSQNGAFGAGFLEGWHSTGTMPEFSLVTGISTGALQATGVFIGRPEITVSGYTIEGEADLLETYVDGSDLEDGLSLGAAITALREGAIADLVPLRSRLDALFTPDILEQVAARYNPEGNGAYLLVGATDVDLGRAVAFDMTELASRYVAAPEGSEQRKLLKGCYIEALLASSIVPPGAKPVFIDNRMYIDGGVRYAVFDDRIGGLLRDRIDTVRALQPVPPSLYILLNSSGAPKAECGKVDPADCEPLSSIEGQLLDWDLVSLAFRSIELLIDQVERLSIARAEERAQAQPGGVFFARINAEDLDDPQFAADLPEFGGTKTCNEWFDEDIALDQPVEFHTRYMRCMIEYGRTRGAALDWNSAAQ